MSETSERRFPIQGGLTVTWSAAERAYRTYSRLYGTSQSLDQLAERGGFGFYEFVRLFDGHRDSTPLEDRIVLVLRESDIRVARGSEHE